MSKVPITAVPPPFGATNRKNVMNTLLKYSHCSHTDDATGSLFRSLRQNHAPTVYPRSQSLKIRITPQRSHSVDINLLRE